MKISEEINISNKGFLLNQHTGESMKLPPAALEIINLIAAGKSPNEIEDAFLTKYEVDVYTYEKYFYDFLSFLRRHRIITAQTNSALN